MHTEFGEAIIRTMIEHEQPFDHEAGIVGPLLSVSEGLMRICSEMAAIADLFGNTDLANHALTTRDSAQDIHDSLQK